MSLFEPAYVSDPTDGQLAHLYGLNLYRAFVWKHLSEILPANDPRKVNLKTAAAVHARASIDAVVGSDYMVEHWLASYAVLYLSSASAQKNGNLKQSPHRLPTRKERPREPDRPPKE